MKKVKFIGTVETFYFVPDHESETAVIYLDVTTEQMLPSGREKTFVPAKRMRFLLKEREINIWSRGKSIVSGDKITICAFEDSDGEFSYHIDSISPKTPIIDAEDYVKHLKD